MDHNHSLASFIQLGDLRRSFMSVTQCVFVWVIVREPLYFPLALGMWWVQENMGHALQCDEQTAPYEAAAFSLPCGTAGSHYSMRQPSNPACTLLFILICDFTAQAQEDNSFQVYHLYFWTWTHLVICLNINFIWWSSWIFNCTTIMLHNVKKTAQCEVLRTYFTAKDPVFSEAHGR